MFKERFKNLKKYKTKKNVLKRKSFELFRDDNRTKAGKQLDENQERLYEWIIGIRFRCGYINNQKY